MQKVAYAVAVCCVTGALLLPMHTVRAFEWGGRFDAVVPCWNAAIYTAVSAPLGGAFIWTPFTKTYGNGPPSRVGQYGLGLAGPPYMCVVSPFPTIVLPGTMMLMVGTSK